MRYFLLAGNDYYPQGGWNDFVASADSIEELTPIAEPGSFVTKYRFRDATYEWFHIVDAVDAQVVLDDIPAPTRS